MTDDLIARLRAEADAMRAAVNGVGTDGFFHALNWSDKPHRVVYDAVARIREAADALEASRAALKAVKAEVESGAILACEDLVLAALPVNGTREIDHG